MLKCRDLSNGIQVIVSQFCLAERLQLGRCPSRHWLALTNDIARDLG